MTDDRALAGDLATAAGELLLDVRANSGLAGKELGRAGDLRSNDFLLERLRAQRPDDARGVVMVGGGLPMRFLEATWPPGVPGQVHVTAGDPFHEEDRQFDPMVDEQLQDDVEQAGGAYSYVEYQGEGHLFNDPTLTSEYQPEEARILTRRIIEFVDEVG